MIEAIAAANDGHVLAYGDDPLSLSAADSVRQALGAPRAEVGFVLSGTGVNVVALGVACRPWESVICAENAHVNTDECAAPERVAGVKLVPVPAVDGRLNPDLVRPHLQGFGFEHHAQPRLLTITQSTEFGTVYRPEAMRELADIAHAHGMLLHVDGARLANAAASLGVSLGEASVACGVDVLSLGFTKCGAVMAEAVVVITPSLCRDPGTPTEEASLLEYVRKGSGQLFSKNRFVAAQFEAMLRDELWRECASAANAMAARLAAGALHAGVVPVFPVEANEVFVRLPASAVPALMEEYRFYVWDEHPDDAGQLLVRWVTAWDTTEDDVDRLIDAVARSV